MSIQISLRQPAGEVHVGVIHELSSGETRFVFDESYCL